MTGEATAVKESTGGRREQCNIVAMPETSPASKTSTCHKTVRSGTIYDFDMQERRRESLERAEKLKAELGDEPITGTDDRIAYRFVKRVFDFAFSAAVLVLLSWLFVIIAILVKVDDPKGPVFFKQQRATKDGRIFKVYKYRTMKVHEPGEEFSATENDDRITRVGRILRKFRVDEIPQVLNILKGDMSLVGPRPEMLENVYRYTQELPEFEYRLRVKAGLTGLAQVAGKYNTSPKDKLILDLMYIERYSIWQDIMLLLRTLIVFFKSEESTQGFSTPADPAEADVVFVKHEEEIKENAER